MAKSNTPYDDAFRFVYTKRPNLLIPVINHVFGTNYNMDQKVGLWQNEQFLRHRDEENEKRNTDLLLSVFEDGIPWENIPSYHFECQTYQDKSIVLRIFEYGSQRAMQDCVQSPNRTKFKFPHAAILRLKRGTADEEDVHTIEIETYGGSVEYQVPVIKMQKYTIDEIFKNRLYFFIPFYIFYYDGQLKNINTDADRVQMLYKEYESIVTRLEALAEDGELETDDLAVIYEATKDVIDQLARNEPNIIKEVADYMGGKVLESKVEKARREERLDLLIEMVRDNDTSIESAAKRVKLSVAEFIKEMEKREPVH